MTSEQDNLEITTVLPDVSETAGVKKRNRPRVSLEKWALFQNESFPELHYRSIKAIVKDRGTHHLKMSQVMQLLQTPDVITPLGRIRKRTRAERLIWFPRKSKTTFDEKSSSEDSAPKTPRTRRKPKSKPSVISPAIPDESDSSSLVDLTI